MQILLTTQPKHLAPSYKFTHQQQIQLTCTNPTMNHQAITYNNKCCYCKAQHLTAVPTCVTYCSQCDSIHNKTDLVDGMCPKMTAFGKKVENKPIPCEFCESQEVLQEAEKQLTEQLAFLQLSSQVEIERETGCARCFGKKFIPRIIECCQQGCNKCGYLTVKINPAAKQEHMKPIPASFQEDCPICHSTIMKGNPIFRMQCNHQYHFLCLAEWLKISSSCPVCRQKDMFIQLAPSYFQEVRRLRMENGEKQPVTINEEGEIVIGDLGEDQDDQDESDGHYIVELDDEDFFNPFDDEILQQ